MFSSPIVVPTLKMMPRKNQMGKRRSKQEPAEPVFGEAQQTPPNSADREPADQSRNHQSQTPKKRKFARSAEQVINIDQADVEDLGAPSQTHNNAEAPDAAEDTAESTPLSTPKGRKVMSPGTSADKVSPQAMNVQGPFLTDFVERQLQSLATGLHSDVSFVVKGGKKIRCHSLYLLQNSPTLAAIANLKMPQMLEVTPEHFLYILEILYIGRTKEPQEVKTLLTMGHFSAEYNVPAVAAFCMKQLAEVLDPNNVFGVLNLAFAVKDVDMVTICLEMVQRYTGTALKSQFFLEYCNASQLKLVVKQKQLSGISELELFEACIAWANAKPATTRRVALEDTIMCYIRFRRFTAEEFAKHVCPTGLLPDNIWRDILRACATGDHKFIPKGYSTSIENRNDMAA